MFNESRYSILHQALFYVSGAVFVYSLIVNPITTIWAMLYACVTGAMVVSSYYHRYLSHRSWQCPRWMEVLLLVLGAGHAYMPAVSWVNVHHRHHRYSDTDKDPHGPRKSLFSNLNLAMHQFDRRFASRSLLSDQAVMFQLKYYWLIMLVYFGVWSLLFSPTTWFIITGHTFLSLVLVNIIGHLRHTPTNIPLIGLFFAGETYHKSHHQNPSNARFGSVDPGWWFIKTVQVLEKR